MNNKLTGVKTYQLDGTDWELIDIATYYWSEQKATDISTILPNVIQVYPNPTTGQLIINTAQLAGNNIIIYDVMGKVMLTVPVSSLYTTLDISNLPAGTYFLRIGTETVNVVKN